MKINHFDLDQIHVLDKNGVETTIEEIRKGKAILVNFYEPGCKGCEIEKPALTKLYKKSLKGEDFIMISIAETDLKTQKERLEKKGYSLEYAQLLNTELLGDFPIPTTLYFNAKGERVKQLTGPQEWDSEKVYAFLVENR